MDDPKFYCKILKLLSKKGFNTYSDVTHLFKNYKPRTLDEFLYADNPQTRIMCEYLDYMANNQHIIFRAVGGKLRETNVEATITQAGLKYYREEESFYRSKLNTFITYTFTIISITVSIVALSLNWGKDKKNENLTKRIQSLELRLTTRENNK